MLICLLGFCLDIARCTKKVLGRLRCYKYTKYMSCTRYKGIINERMAKWPESWTLMYAKSACFPRVLSSFHFGGPLVLAGVELPTMNIERFASSAARLVYQRRSGVSTVYGCKNPRDPLVRSIEKRWGTSPIPRVTRHFFVP